MTMVQPINLFFNRTTVPIRVERVHPNKVDGVKQDSHPNHSSTAAQQARRGSTEQNPSQDTMKQYCLLLIPWKPTWQQRQAHRYHK